MTNNEIKRLRDMLAQLPQHGSGRAARTAVARAIALDALPTLLDEVERLRADAARLDHIEKHARYDPKIDGNHAWWPTTFENVLRGPTLRAAIDAAMGGEARE